MSLYIDRKRKTSIIRKKHFPDYQKKNRYGSRVSLTQAAMGFAQRLRRFNLSHAACNRRFRAAQSFALVRKNLIYSTFFVGGGNNTLKLISNWTVAVDFFVNLILKPSIIRKMPALPEYWGFQFPADRNRHRIWNFQVLLYVITCIMNYLPWFFGITGLFRIDNN